MNQDEPKTEENIEIWPVFEMGEIIRLKGYPFKVTYLKKDRISLEPLSDQEAAQRSSTPCEPKTPLSVILPQRSKTTTGPPATAPNVEDVVLVTDPLGGPALPEVRFDDKGWRIDLNDKPQAVFIGNAKEAEAEMYNLYRQHSMEVMGTTKTFYTARHWSFQEIPIRRRRNG